MIRFSGEKLAKIRMDKGVTQADLAQAISNGTGYRQKIYSYEKGLRTPSTTTLEKIAHVLGVHPGSFYDETQGEIQ